MAMTGTLPEFLRDKNLRLLLFGGKGGVGKTTCATAAALHLAWGAPKTSFLLVSTDPAHSLYDSLAGPPILPNLSVIELNARLSLERFKAAHGQRLREIASLGTFLDEEDVNRFLTLTLPGLDELLSLLEISRCIAEGRHDRILVDTAPTLHTLRLLSMSELMRKWLEVLDALLSEYRHMAELYRGADHEDELDGFFHELRTSVEEMEELLRDPKRSLFVPVTMAEPLAVCETVSLVRELERLGLPTGGIVVNRLYPSNSCPQCGSGYLRQIGQLKLLARELPGHRLWGVPLYHEEVRGLGPLGLFWDGATKLNGDRGRHGGSAVPIHSGISTVQSSPFAEGALDLPPPEAKLLIFAGKGGAGKTTLASAAAVRLSSGAAGREIFLYSADPTYPLSSCLNKRIGPRPRRLAPRLTAVEADPQMELETFKSQYSEGLNRFLSSLPPELDLTFDRKVMEKIMDLAPPGLDEFMALCRAVEIFCRENYHTLIIDSAPTGHLIRLLEMPEIAGQWLTGFFELFLKYEPIFRLPKIHRLLTIMSENLERLRSLWKDPTGSALYIVSTPTAMGYEETKRIMAACRESGLHIPAILLNLATPAGGCALCNSLRRSEAKVERKFRKAFPGVQCATIYRGVEPRGLEELRRLGEAVFRPSKIESAPEERYARASSR